MRYRLLRFVTVLIGVVLLTAPVFAAPIEEVAELADSYMAPPQETFYKARVLGIDDAPTETGLSGLKTLRLRILNGEKKHQEVATDPFVPDSNRQDQNYAIGNTLVIVESVTAGTTSYYVIDYYRLPALLVILLVFLLVSVLIARRRAAFALTGLALSILMLSYIIVPRLAQGQNPWLVGALGALVIAVIALYVGHGWHKRTHIALAGTLITLLIAAGVSALFVRFSRLFGTGSEDAYNLQLTLGAHLNFRSLLLVGIIIGALGVLDDITTSLASSVEEIHRADPKLSGLELYKRGARIGREHIASLINTLVLAYAGAALPLFLLFTFVQQPLWVILNSQFLAEEITRTLVGSLALVLAVPITTFLAARAYSKK